MLENEQQMRDEVVDNTAEQTDAVDYISAINEIKQNSVPREKYEQLEREKKELINALKSNSQINLVDDREKKSIDELRSDLFNSGKDLSNLEYVERTLALRDALIENGEQDPFLPNGKNYSITQDDINKAEMVAQTFRECVDYANGNSQLFTQELMRRTRDDGPLRRSR